MGNRTVLTGAVRSQKTIAFPLSMGTSVPEDTEPTVIIEIRVTPLLYDTLRILGKDIHKTFYTNVVINQ